MSTRIVRFLSLVLMVVGAAPLAACGALSGPAVEGQVLEAGSNTPIPGAIVVVLWRGSVSALVDSQSVCVHVDSAVTDEDGRYRFPAWRKSSEVGPAALVSALTPFAEAHKPGYEQAGYGKDLAVYLRRSVHGRAERFNYLWSVIRSSGCHNAGLSRRNLYPLYQAVYEEGKPLAMTDEQKRRLQLWREIAASAWVAEDRPMTSSEEKKLIDQHLRKHLK